MPYLNDVRLVVNLAVVPEMTLTNSGRQYCNFSVRVVFRTKLGDPIEDFINITCHDADAEMVVRDCEKGDLLLILGFLTQQHWEVNGQHQSKLIVIADSVQRLAKGNGMMPQMTDKDLQDADVLTMDEESPFISSVCMTRRPLFGLPDRAKYPQPVKGGGWEIPANANNAGTREWVQQNTFAIEDTVRQSKATEDETKRKEAEKQMAALQAQARNIGVLPSNGSDDSPVSPTARKMAKRVYPDSLIPRLTMRGYVVELESGSAIPFDNYRNILDGQCAWLNALEANTLAEVELVLKEERNITLKRDETGKFFNPYAGVVMKPPQPEPQPPPPFVMPEMEQTQGDGSSPDDWVQDENGQWVRR